VVCRVTLNFENWDIADVIRILLAELY